MRDIRRPDSAEPLIERLTTSGSSDEPAIFSTIMDLLIFAAGIGFSLKRRSPVPTGGKGVPIRIFENNQKDGLIYMLALAATEDPKSLLPEHDEKTAMIFEEYAAAGLEEIQMWLNANATDIDGVQTLMTKLQAQVVARPIVVPDLDPI